MAVRTAANRAAANRARIIAWSRVRDDVGLTNQVCALKTRSGIQKNRRQFNFRFRAPLTFLVATKLTLDIGFGSVLTKFLNCNELVDGLLRYWG